MPHLSPLSPDEEHPLLSEAMALHRAGHLEDAAERYLKISADLPHHFDATHLLGVAALQLGRYEAAKGLLHAALVINPNEVNAMGNLGTCYMRLGELDHALQWFELAAKIKPDSPVALSNLGTALHNMNRHSEAIPILQRAYAADPGSYAICNLLGACLLKTGTLREATELFDAAVRADPANGDAWANLAAALNAAGQHDRARNCAEQAVALSPNSAKALGARGTAEFEGGRLASAIETYRQGAALPQPSVGMLIAFGNALIASGLNEEAVEQLKRAAELDHTNLTARWAMAIAKLKTIYQTKAELLASRDDFMKSLEEVHAWYRATPAAQEPFVTVGSIQPFFIAYQPFNNVEPLKKYGAMCAEFMNTLPAELRGQISEPEPLQGRKIRLGLASSHFQKHSVWAAITRGWVHHIDRSRFELHLFHLSPTADSETAEARKLATHYENKPSTLPDWIKAIRAQKLDALIYPDIGMHPLTLQLASLRLAPVQATSWGHPETSGLPTIDLFFSAEGFEPAEASQNYSERLVRLPNLGVYVEPLAPIITEAGLASLSLPKNVPLLLCAGTPFKYSPLHDEVWVEVARNLPRTLFGRSPRGRLVFFRSGNDLVDAALEKQLRTAFARRDVDFDDHVTLLPFLERGRFYGLMRESAVMLDTLGFSGFNTALQGIECGLPVLAYEGAFMRGRLASAILRRLELPELVAKTSEEFVHKAVCLAADPAERNRLRKLIVERREVLFRDLAPIRALEHHLSEALMERIGRPV